MTQKPKLTTTRPLTGGNGEGASFMTPQSESSPVDHSSSSSSQQSQQQQQQEMRNSLYFDANQHTTNPVKGDESNKEVGNHEDKELRQSQHSSHQHHQQQQQQPQSQTLTPSSQQSYGARRPSSIASTYSEPAQHSNLQFRYHAPQPTSQSGEVSRSRRRNRHHHDTPSAPPQDSLFLTIFLYPFCSGMALGLGTLCITTLTELYKNYRRA